MRYLVLTALCAALVPVSATASRLTFVTLQGPITQAEKKKALAIVADCERPPKPRRVKKSASRTVRPAQARASKTQCFIIGTQKKGLITLVPYFTES